MAISKLILNGETQMDVTSNTNTSNNMLSGVVGTKNDGTSVTGNIASKSSTDLTVSGATVTAPAGYYANAASKAVATVVHPDPTAVLTSSTGMIVAGHTQETGYVTGGTTTTMLSLTTQTAKTVTPTESIQTAVPSYRWTTGNVNVAAISSTYVGTGVPKYSAGDLVASGSGVTVLTGYYSSTVTKLIAAGSAFPPAVTITKAPTIGVNTSGVVTASYSGSSSITPTVNAGYISQGTAGTISTTGTSTYQLTSQAAATYYPSTADQTIASQRWLVGNQTIKSVTTSNLTAENIAEGVVVQVGDSANASRITQVTGTHVDSNKYTITITSTASYYRCIIYKGVHYYTAGQSFQISAGETIELYCSSSTRFLYINGENVLMPEESYIYTPSGDINADLNKGSTISIYESIIPTGSMPITSNASYNVYGYSAVNVDVNFDIDVEAPYYNAYKTIALKSSIYSSNTDIVSYFNTISSIIPYQFEDICMSGSFTFPVCTIIGDGGFQHTGYNRCLFCTFDFPEVESIGLFAFKLQSRLTSINAPKATVIKAQAFMSCTSLQTVNFPKVTGISDSAFFDCRALTTVSFPEASYIYTSAFNGCQNLSSISFPKISQIGIYAFARCYSLTTADFPSTTSIGAYAFQSCSNLTTANFPSATSIGQLAFYGCSNLLSISFPNTTYIGSSTFYNCIKLIEASFPKLSEIEMYAFDNCSSLTTANFASATLVSSGGFNNCINLTTISFPELLTIHYSAFAYCSALTTVDFPKVTIVGSYAFRGCTNLTTASFPNVVSIALSAFYSCYHLLSLYLLGSSVVSLAGTGAFWYTPISTYTTSTGGVYGSIFVPASLYSSYLTATNWSVYSSRFVSV